MRSFRLPRTRGLLGILLGVVMLSLGGCVYLRLLELKNQLADFDRHFQIDSKDGVRLVCLEPLLYSDDLRWLGVAPEKSERQGDAESWHVRWVKEVPPGITETAVYDVELGVRFVRDRLVEIDIAERFFAFFPKEVFVRLIRSAGQAQIDRGARKANVNTGVPPEALRSQLPKVSSIEEMLGHPSEKSIADGKMSYRYRYKPVAPSAKIKPIDMLFVFNLNTGRLERLTGKLPTGTVDFDLASNVSGSEKSN
jgi:hypothetical protein